VEGRLHDRVGASVGVVSVLKNGLEFVSSQRNKPIAAPAAQPPLRFLFASLGHIESEFYGRVGDELAACGHQVAHVVYSRWSARALAAKGYRSFCLPDRMASLGDVEVENQAAAISKAYGVTGCREIYRTDFEIAAA
jgi:hypothetical protein